MNTKYQELFQSQALNCEFRPAVFIEHEDIDDYASELLSGIFGRDIYAEGKREEFYDWSIIICDDSISEDELETLHGIIGSTDDDREHQLCVSEGEDSIYELCQRVATKLFSKIMPFKAEKSFADDEGIWLLGGLTDTSVGFKVESEIMDVKIDNTSGDRRCACGNTRFSASQECYHDVIVDSDNNYIRDVGIGEAENPYGPYTCTSCDAVYEDLDDLDDMTGGERDE